VVPDRPAPSRGETFTVEVVLTGARDITSVPFHLQFDPGILQYLGARTGPALNGRSLQPIFLASVNPARPGDLAVGLSLVRTSGTFSGSGTILLLDFLALAAGRSDLLFDRASVRGPTSAPLPAEIVGAAAEVR
jgi:cohesin domain-containing protein